MSVVDPGSEGGHHHHQHTGHRWLDITLAVSAVIISLVSLFLTLQHGRVMERMVEANTWPYVMVDVTTSNLDGSPHVALRMENKGVGPAKIESLEVFYQGVAMPGSHALVKAVLAPSDPDRRFRVLISDVLESVLSAREVVNFVDLDPKNYSVQEYGKMADVVTKLDFRVCYCSVFDECAVLDTRKAQRPFAVKSCSVPRIMFAH
jgi:hypothetical protein